MIQGLLQSGQFLDVDIAELRRIAEAIDERVRIAPGFEVHFHCAPILSLQAFGCMGFRPVCGFNLRR